MQFESRSTHSPDVPIRNNGPHYHRTGLHCLHVPTWWLPSSAAQPANAPNSPTTSAVTSPPHAPLSVPDDVGNARNTRNILEAQLPLPAYSQRRAQPDRHQPA